jgi:hypothetical protein
LHHTEPFSLASFGGLVKALVEVAVDVDVDVLGDADGGVAEEPGDVFDA